MKMHLHDSKSLYTKVLQVNHGLTKQVAIEGNGRGEYRIIEGCPQIHKVVHELLKIDIVWRVCCDEGYLMITVSEPDRWPQIIGEVQATTARILNAEKPKD